MLRGKKKDGYAVHWVNLLTQDITPLSSKKYVVETKTYFRNHHQPVVWLIFYDLVKLQLPSETIWSSQVEYIPKFIKNRPVFLNICEKKESNINIKKYIYI